MIQDRKDLRDPLEPRAIQDHKDLRDPLEPRAIQELQVPLGRKGIRVPKATQVRKVRRDLPA